MKNIPIDERRCRGYEPGGNVICPKRNQCARHVQLSRDRDLRLPDYVPVRIMTIGYVAANDCSLYLREAAR